MDSTEPIEIGGAYWNMSPNALFARLASAPSGLGNVEAGARRARVGANRLRDPEHASAPRLLLNQFRSPLVLILVFAACIALLVRDWLEATIVLVIVLTSAGLGFMQEFRASNAIQRLRARVALNASVWRDGNIAAVPVADVVPGDVVLLSAGSLIPADGVLLEAKDFFVNQALLTGESLPVEKFPGVAAPDAPLAARHNVVFMGTSVRSGTARALIVRTGLHTEMGAVAERLARPAPETGFERGLRQFGVLLARFAAVMVLAVFVIHVYFERSTIESLLFAVALAVGLSPELLPTILTVTLARGARDLAKHGAIVRRLNAIENLGSMDVLCTDKTGTLTEGTMRIERAVDAAGNPSTAVFADALLNARMQTGLVNPLDDAIRAEGDRAGVHDPDARKLDEIPYDFARKRLSIAMASGSGAPRLITKGAVYEILSICDFVLENDVSVALDDARRAAIEQRFRVWSEAGFRVLAVATRALPARESYTRTDEQHLIFSGFLLFADPPDPQAKRAVHDLAQLGVEVKMITGDNRYIAAHVAQAVGLRSVRALTGPELHAMRDEALWHAVRETGIFAEVDPAQKERIIGALKKNSQVVGFLGDGINDAPALHAADVGISVQHAVDVARESADVVLVSHDLHVLRAAIEQGRQTFANTIKYIFITTSANFGNMISMAAASLFLPFLPLLAKQILLNNFLSDVPAVFIAGDRVDKEWSRKPYHWNIAAIRNFMIVFGLVSSVFDFITFYVLWRLGQGDATLFRSGWFIESLLTELAVAIVLRTAMPFYRSRPGTLLWQSTLAVALLTLALPYLPGAQIFDLAPLPAPFMIAIVLIACAYVAATEVTKRLFYRRMRHNHRNLGR